MIPGDELIYALADPKSGLSITPLIDAAGQIGEGSIDIRLGPDIIVSPRATGATAFDPTESPTFRRNLEQRQQYIRRGIGDPFQLQPGEFVIGRSLEYVTLPEDVSAEALGRSSWGRLGLVIATATLIQPRFKGTITLELANVGDTPIVLTVGLSIAQLVFSRSPVARGSRKRKSGLTRSERKRVKEWQQRHRRQIEGQGRYKLQIKPALSRLDKDDDLRWVTPLAVRYALGIVGMPYSGKSTVIDFLTTHRHFRLYRLTQFIFEEARRRGLDAEDPRILRQVGDSMRDTYGEAALAQMAFERIRSEMVDPDRSRNLTPIAIEGFRLPDELLAWKDIEFFRPLIVSANVGVRRKRAIEQGWLDDQRLRELDYPADGSEEDRDNWFITSIDTPTGGHPRNELNRIASEHPKAILINNEFDSVLELREHLKAQVAELEKWWRAREY